MSTKKVSYIQLLKEAIQEYDAKSMDYKGPMTEPVLTFDGEGELTTNKDASSILERYYFKETEEKLLECGPDNSAEGDAEEDSIDPNEIVTGEEADDVDETMDDLEDELLDEELNLEDYEPGDSDIVAKDKPLEEDLELEDYEPGDSDIVAKDEPLEDSKKDVMNSETVSLENAIIEKLIEEMEEEAKQAEPSDTGTEEAGTKPVKDSEEDILGEDFDLLEETDPEADAAEKELDVDSGVEDKKKVVPEGEGMGPIRVKAARELEEAFSLFKEQIEKEEGEEDKKEDEKKEKGEEVETEDFDLFEEDFDLLEGEDEGSEEDKKEDKEEDEEK